MPAGSAAACAASSGGLVEAGRAVFARGCADIDADPSAIPACFGLGVECAGDGASFSYARSLGGAVYAVEVFSCADARSLGAAFCADLAEMGGRRSAPERDCAAFLADLAGRAAAILPATCDAAPPDPQ